MSSTVAPAASMLSVELDERGTTCLVSLIGVLRDSSILALERQIDLLGQMSCHEVVIDLRQLEAIDVVGVNVLVGLSYYVGARGGSMELIGARDEVAKALADSPIPRRREGGNSQGCAIEP